MAATFSITLDKNVRLDTGRKLEKISKSRDGFFNRGDNTVFFMELGIEAELNERLTTLLIIGFLPPAVSFNPSSSPNKM